jgi:hypothetical protein
VKSIKKTTPTFAVFLTMFIISVFGVQLVKAPYTADGQGFPLASPIKILSPTNITYSKKELTLIVTFKFLLSPKYSNLSYSIDRKNNITIPLIGTREPREVTRTYPNGTSVIVNSTLMVPFDIRGEIVLPELSEGYHNITVYARYLANQIVAFDESTVYFSISPDPEQQIPEFPSLKTLLIMSVAVLITAVIYKGKIIKPEDRGALQRSLKPAPTGLLSETAFRSLFFYDTIA